MKAAIALLLAAFLLFAGCTTAPQPPIKQNTSAPPARPANNSTSIGLANPASVNCVNAGYKDEIRTDSSGAQAGTSPSGVREGGAAGQAGYCVFPNGRECEEWAFFRGECTDADSFAMVEAPGYVEHPEIITYKFYADGRLTLTESYPENGSSSTLIAWLKPSDFAAFIKSISTMGYPSLASEYQTCGTEVGCPTDGPSITLSLLKQGSSQGVYLYGPADHPKNLDGIISSFKQLFENSTFVNVDTSGCSLMKNSNGQLGCYGTVKGITNPAANSAPAGYVAAATDGSLGSCTVDAEGACAYLAPGQMTQLLCSNAKGHWNSCGTPEACRDPRVDRVCPQVCTQYCECGGIAGFGCPTGYFCTEYEPVGAADAMGLCKPLS